jgi:hypothetical protein
MDRVLAADAAREEQCDARKGEIPSRDVLGHEAVAKETFGEKRQHDRNQQPAYVQCSKAATGCTGARNRYNWPWSIELEVKAWLSTALGREFLPEAGLGVAEPGAQE